MWDHVIHQAETPTLDFVTWKKNNILLCEASDILVLFVTAVSVMLTNAFLHKLFMLHDLH